MKTVNAKKCEHCGAPAVYDTVGAGRECDACYTARQAINRQEHEFTIKDGQTGKVKEITIVAHYGLLEVRVKGYGDYESLPGYGSQLLLDYHDDRLQALVYADINNQEPTHMIDLEGALETNRIPEPEEET